MAARARGRSDELTSQSLRQEPEDVFGHLDRDHVTRVAQLDPELREDRAVVPDFGFGVDREHDGEVEDQPGEEGVALVGQLDDRFVFLPEDEGDDPADLIAARRGSHPDQFGKRHREPQFELEQEPSDHECAIVRLVHLHLCDPSTNVDSCHDTPCNPYEHSQPLWLGNATGLGRPMCTIIIIKSQD